MFVRLVSIVALFSFALPAAKQMYVLRKEIVHPGYYMEKSMFMTPASRKLLVSAIERDESPEIRLCSRSGYDASLYLLIELIRSKLHDRKRIRFPRQSQCRQLADQHGLRSGSVIFFGGGEPPKLLFANNT